MNQRRCACAVPTRGNGEDGPHPEHAEAPSAACRQALAQDPTKAEAYYRSGSVYQDRGRVEKAEICYRQAMALAPQDERYSFSLGWTLQAQGRLEEAAECYGRTLNHRPDCAPAHYNLGLLHLERQEFDEAAAALQKAVDLQPEFSPALNNLGAAWMALGHSQRARECFQAAIEADSGYVEAYCNLGRLLFAEKRWNDALECFYHALALRPAAVETLHHIGLCHHKCRRLDQAQRWYQKALALRPDDFRIQIDMGNVFLDRGDLNTMTAWYRKAADHMPEKSGALLNVARMLQDQGRWNDSLTCCEQALTHDPLNAEAHFERSLLLLRLGRMPEGWEEYEWRYRRENRRTAYPHRLRSVRWDGSGFQGRTLLVHCEQGLGDTLQFARYLPLVKARGGTVVFEVQAALFSLFKGFLGCDEVVALAPAGPTERPHDCHIPLLSLPRVFATTLKTIPAACPYGSIDPQHRTLWNSRLETGGIRVGIAWAGSAWFTRDAKRSCGLAPFQTLASLPGIRWIGLQKGAAAKQPTDLSGDLHLVNYGAKLRDFRDTAALVSVLDLVISVDTAVAHLAGSMGTPTWVLLPFVSDWRWLDAREDSPWYPSMRLFRQARGETWTEVFRRVAAALQTLTQTPNHRTRRARGRDE